MMALESYRDTVLIKLELALGCRRSDIVRIKWDDVKEEDFSITYKEMKKGDRPHTAFVSDDIMVMLKRHRGLSRGKYIFPAVSTDKNHLSDRTAYNILVRAMRRAEIIGKNKCWPFHALRATCIKNCQRAKWTPAQTAAHVNDTIRVIQEHYETPSMLERQETARDKAII